MADNTQSLDPRTSSNEEVIKDPGYYAAELAEDYLLMIMSTQLI